MSRGLTPLEIAERRRENLEKAAAGLGITPEELEKLNRQARKSLASRHKASKEETEEALRVAMTLVESGVVQPTPSEAANIDDMSVEEFGAVIAHYLQIVDALDRQLVIKAVARWIACWRGGEDEPMTLREEIMLDLQAMTRRYNKK